MPTFVLKCINDECGFVEETNPTCKYSDAITRLCTKCGAKTKTQAQPVAGKVNGLSAANGYHRETINYDGSDRAW